MPDEHGFTLLWPTLFLRRIVPGHEAANRELFSYIKSLERERKNLTTDYLGGNLLGTDNPAVAWLKDCINITVRDYLARAGIGYAVNWSLQGWANINRFGDYHDPHNHPHAYLSGTYYVRVPTQREKLNNRNDVRPGCISFYDPRAGTNMGAIKDDPNIEAEHTVMPEPGMILLWPAFINHFVHPNLSKQLRVSVSFNVVLKWSDEYLPNQP